MLGKAMVNIGRAGMGAEISAWVGTLKQTEGKESGVESRVKREGIMAQKLLLYKYQLLRSEPGDSLEKVHFNYMSLKK